MSTFEKKETQETRKIFRVPSNRYLRHQHTKLGDTAIFIFFIGSQAYGVELAKVKRTLPNTSVVKVVDLPEHVTGIVKHKNLVVPVINLHAYLKLNSTQTSSEAPIVILKINQQFVGMQIESIAEPIFTRDIKMLSMPLNSFAIDSQFLLGVAKMKDREVALLDIEKLLENNNVLSNALSQVQAISLNSIGDFETKI